MLVVNVVENLLLITKLILFLGAKDNIMSLHIHT